MIKSKKLSKYKIVSHGFFDSKGGKSKGIYKSLNCGIGSSDYQKNVKQNLRIVCQKLSLNYEKLFLLNQVHGSKFHFLNKNYKKNNKKLTGDALITNQKKLIIGVLTADCVPILIYDNSSKFIAAIHAGWKGAYKNIISKVINFMVKKGCKRKNICAAIGPCISQKNYEVKNDFYSKFIKKYIT